MSASASSRKHGRIAKKPVRASAHPAKKSPGKKPAGAKPAAPNAGARRVVLVEAPPRPKPKSPFVKKELAQFRAALMALRTHRIGDKESREQEALKSTGQDVSVDHMADYGTDNYEQEFTLGILEQDVETIRDIHDALGRIKEGSYGLCEECLKPIARARLRAIPYARLCVDCKMKEE